MTSFRYTFRLTTAVCASLAVLTIQPYHAVAQDITAAYEAPFKDHVQLIIAVACSRKVLPSKSLLSEAWSLGSASPIAQQEHGSVPRKVRWVPAGSWEVCPRSHAKPSAMDYHALIVLMSFCWMASDWCLVRKRTKKPAVQLVALTPLGRRAICVSRRMLRIGKSLAMMALS
nr:hypothetical protein [Pseudovibrio denitrificans]